MLDDVSPGQMLGRYELLLPVARGGMASVWAARQKGTRGFQKLVAIKTMLPGLADDPSFERMFLAEAQVALQVKHPQVIEIYDLGEQDRVLYLVMEWVSGEALSIIMKYAATRGGIPLPIAVRIAAQACRGLHAAHELRDDSGALVGLVHRDVSPQNVLVSFDGVVKVVDFGVAKATARVEVQTEAGQLKGKIAYMSPEQLRGDQIDRRTDVFAMGILLYMMTTGRHPFRGEDQAQTISRISSDQPALTPSTLVPGYPPALEGVVMQALAKDPAKRYPSASDLLMGLSRALPPALRESTDEEVAEFLRRLVPDRVERHRQALKLALDAADRRDVVRSTPPPLNASEGPEEPATVLEGLGREFTPSAEGRSLPGASSSAPPSSASRDGKRPSTWVFGVGLVLLGAGLAWVIGRGTERADRNAAISSSERGPGAAPLTNAFGATPNASPAGGPSQVAPAPNAAEPSPTPPVTDAEAAAPEVSGHSSARKSPLRRRPLARPPASTDEPAPDPFVSPIRTPGF